MFPFRPSSNDSLGLVIVAAPIVFLLCWLYNARRLGKFKKKQSAPANAAYNSRREKISLTLFVLALCVGLPLLLRLIF